MACDAVRRGTGGASGVRGAPGAWRADDAPAVLLAVRDPAIARWNPVDRPDPDLRVAQAWVEDRGDWTGSEHASFAVVTVDDDELLGSVSLFKIDRVHDNAEIGTGRCRGRGEGKSPPPRLTWSPGGRST